MTRMPLLRAAGDGGRFAQNLSKIFFKIFFLFTANVSNCANCLRRAIARRMGRMQQASLLRLGVASLKICQKSFFLIFISFYRRFFLFVVAASCVRQRGSLRSKSFKNLF